MTILIKKVELFKLSQGVFPGTGGVGNQYELTSSQNIFKLHMVHLSGFFFFLNKRN